MTDRSPAVQLPGFFFYMTTDYSIIIPAYNEEELLPRTLRSVQLAMSATEFAGEIIVVDNNSIDKTALIARQSGARVVTEVVNQISRVRNTGGRAANGRYLIFLDADTAITAELLEKALALLVSGCCCGGGTQVYGDSELTPVSEMFMSLWNRMSLRFGWAAGCFVFCLREGFDAVGGFSEKVYASEEIWFSRKLGAWGRARDMEFEIITDPGIVTSMRKLEWFTTTDMLRQVFLLILFPPAVFFRRLCRPWYERPSKSEE